MSFKPNPPMLIEHQPRKIFPIKKTSRGWKYALMGSSRDQMVDARLGEQIDVIMARYIAKLVVT